MMPTLIYDTRPAQSRGGADPDNPPDPVQMYATHYVNALRLMATMKRSTDARIRQACTEELAIADRKMTYWQRQDGWSQAGAEAACRPWRLLARNNQLSPLPPTMKGVAAHV